MTCTVERTSWAGKPSPASLTLPAAPVAAFSRQPGGHQYQCFRRGWQGSARPRWHRVISDSLQSMFAKCLLLLWIAATASAQQPGQRPPEAAKHAPTDSSRKSELSHARGAVPHDLGTPEVAIPNGYTGRFFVFFQDTGDPYTLTARDTASGEYWTFTTADGYSSGKIDAGPDRSLRFEPTHKGENCDGRYLRGIQASVPAGGGKNVSIAFEERCTLPIGQPGHPVYRFTQPISVDIHLRPAQTH
jgi:hypothetical protein